MSQNKPMVSIGMTAYNGERFIRQAIDSLLAQDFKDFELIISDNQSHDKTELICREYAARDGRVRYIRNQANLGAVKSFNLVLKSAKSEKYFMWADDHDVWAPTYLSQCLSILEQSAEIAVVYSQTRMIDERGADLGVVSQRVDTRGMGPGRRFRHLLWHLRNCDMIYGVMRQEALRRTRGFLNVWGGDNVVLGELSFLGTAAQIEQPLFCRRKIRADEPLDIRVERVMHSFEPEAADQKQIKGYFAVLWDWRAANQWAIQHASISVREKILCSLVLAACYLLRLFLPWPLLVAGGKRVLKPILPHD